VHRDLYSFPTRRSSDLNRLGHEFLRKIAPLIRSLRLLIELFSYYLLFLLRFLTNEFKISMRIEPSSSALNLTSLLLLVSTFSDIVFNSEVTMVFLLYALSTVEAYMLSISSSGSMSGWMGSISVTR